jgi:lipopolysaccharide/colanic/teichoic acid biosynthesis glycosyltransferase
MVDQPSDTPPIGSQNQAVLPAPDARWFTSGDIDWPSRERLKRAADVLLASALIVFTFPLAVMVALAIRLDSPGPILVREARLGRNNRLYSTLKFRTTISVPSSASRSRWPLREQATRAGHFLHYSRIEELPRLLNVLRGEMTMTGVRGRTRAFEN